jgi:hypothetical protein
METSKWEPPFCVSCAIIIFLLARANKFSEPNVCPPQYSIVLVEFLETRVGVKEDERKKKKGKKERWIHFKLFSMLVLTPALNFKIRGRSNK